MSKQQEDLQPVGEFTKQRRRAMTHRALGYTVEIKQRTAVHLFTYYAIYAVYILQHFKPLTTVGMLLLA